MSYKLAAKNFLFRMLDKLPPELGFSIYHFFQNQFQNQSLDEKLSATRNSFLTMERLVDLAGITIKNKIILEIGSGWMPIMPYFLKYFAGASEIRTYDLNEHFNPQSVKELNEIFLNKFSYEVKVERENKYNLPGDIKYYPKTDISKENNLNADIVFSRFVLEHVTPEDLRQMHEKFKSSLKPGSYLIHLISPGDHRAYVDKTLSLQDFLKFSPKDWKRRQTKFDYHNRWRLPQYINLFRNLGYEIVHLEYDTPEPTSRNYKLFKKLNIHSDFKDYTEQELMAGALNIVLKT